jgi:hypothetical protein
MAKKLIGAICLEKENGNCPVRSARFSLIERTCERGARGYKTPIHVMNPNAFRHKNTLFSENIFSCI